MTDQRHRASNSRRDAVAHERRPQDQKRRLAAAFTDRCLRTSDETRSGDLCDYWGSGIGRVDPGIAIRVGERHNRPAPSGSRADRDRYTVATALVPTVVLIRN